MIMVVEGSICRLHASFLSINNTLLYYINPLMSTADSTFKI